MKKLVQNEGAYGPLLSRVRTLLWHKKKGVVIIILGAPGDGKSIIAMNLAYLLDKDYHKRDPQKTLEKKVVFTSSDFLKALKEKNMKISSTVIFEDAGTMEAFSARRFMTTSNQALSSVFQTIRRERFVVIVTIQTKKLLDTHLRDSNLSHFMINASAVDFETGQNVFKVYELSHNPTQGKTYHPFLKMKNGGKRCKISLFRAESHLPPALHKCYEKYSKTQKDKIEASIAEKVNAKEDKMKGASKKTVKEIVDEIYSQIQKIVNNEEVPPFISYNKRFKRWGMKKGYLAYEYGLGSEIARQVKQVIEMKMAMDGTTLEMRRIIDQENPIPV